MVASTSRSRSAAPSRLARQRAIAPRRWLRRTVTVRHRERGRRQPLAPSHVDRERRRAATLTPASSSRAELPAFGSSRARAAARQPACTGPSDRAVRSVRVRRRAPCDRRSFASARPCCRWRDPGTPFASSSDHAVCSAARIVCSMVDARIRRVTYATEACRRSRRPASDHAVSGDRAWRSDAATDWRRPSGWSAAQRSHRARWLTRDRRRAGVERSARYEAPSASQAPTATCEPGRASTPQPRARHGWATCSSWSPGNHGARDRRPPRQPDWQMSWSPRHRRLGSRAARPKVSAVAGAHRDASQRRRVAYAAFRAGLIGSYCALYVGAAGRGIARPTGHASWPGAAPRARQVREHDPVGWRARVAGDGTPTRSLRPRRARPTGCAGPRARGCRRRSVPLRSIDSPSAER